MIWFDLRTFDMIRNSNKKGRKTPNENKWKQHLISFDLIHPISDWAWSVNNIKEVTYLVTKSMLRCREGEEGWSWQGTSGMHGMRPTMIM